MKLDTTNIQVTFKIFNIYFFGRFRYTLNVVQHVWSTFVSVPSLTLQRKNSKNPSLLWKWVGGSRSHSELLSLLENHPKIALNQY